jgi:glycosyltransferase involved in cell wall biosynthesis
MVSESIRRSGQSPSERELNLPPEHNPFESVWDAIAPLEDLSNAKPFVSVVVPAYNESEILEQNLETLYRYMEYLEHSYDWEIIIINDGSRDNTGALAEGFALAKPYVRVIHHRINSGLGRALRTGFAAANGEYIVTLDIDLSYTPEHIELLLIRIVQSSADVVVTSPYMRGGLVSNVPWLRLVLSVWANRFLSAAAKRNVSTLTGMVRAYRTSFIRSLNLKTSGMDINPEVIHKGIVLGAKIEEIPAHLNWRTQNDSRRASSDRPKPNRRKSSMKILRHTWNTFYFGFVFRPVMFFIIPSFLFFLLALYAGGWAAIHSWTNYVTLSKISAVTDPTEAVAAAFQQAPHTFVLGGIFLMLSIQLFSLGILSMQSKRYFEEIFQLGTAVYTNTQDTNTQDTSTQDTSTQRSRR